MFHCIFYKCECDIKRSSEAPPQNVHPTPPATRNPEIFVESCVAFPMVSATVPRAQTKTCDVKHWDIYQPLVKRLELGFSYHLRLFPLVISNDHIIHLFCVFVYYIHQVI